MKDPAMLINCLCLVRRALFHVLALHPHYDVRMYEHIPQTKEEVSAQLAYNKRLPIEKLIAKGKSTV